MPSWPRAAAGSATVSEPLIAVECYSGYKGAERPMRLKLREGVREIVSIEDRWYAPGATYFRVLLDDGDRYLLRYEEGRTSGASPGIAPRID